MDHSTWATSFAAVRTESGLVGSKSMAEAGATKTETKQVSAVHACAMPANFMTTCMGSSSSSSSSSSGTAKGASGRTGIAASESGFRDGGTAKFKCLLRQAGAGRSA